MRSLKTRMILSVALAMCLLVVLFGTWLSSQTHTSLVSALDGDLESRARALAALLEVDLGNMEFDYTRESLPAYGPGEDPLYFQIWEGKESKYTSPSLGEAKLTLATQGATACSVCPTTLPDGRAGRLATLWVDLVDEGVALRRKLQGDESEPTLIPMTVSVAASTTGIDRTMDTMQRSIWTGGAGAILMGLLVAFLVVGAGLRPLDRFAGEIDQLDENTLNSRIATETLPTEVASVAAKLNELLERLDSSFERERAFTSDVAHELRTPLAGMRSTIEVTLSRTRSEDAYRESLQQSLGIAAKMESLVEKLLRLARLDEHAATSTDTSTPVEQKLAEVWSSLAAEAELRSVRLDSSVERGLAVRCDEQTLELILSNVLLNAITYGTAGGCIEAKFHGQDGAVVLRFCNMGNTLDSSQVENVFHRFWRGDAARSSQGLNCGLGLALVRAAAMRHGGRATASVDGERFVLTVALPSADA